MSLPIARIEGQDYNIKSNPYSGEEENPFV
jgi:hypothetical protein